VASPYKRRPLYVIFHFFRLIGNYKTIDFRLIGNYFFKLMFFLLKLFALLANRKILNVPFYQCQIRRHILNPAISPTIYYRRRYFEHSDQSIAQRTRRRYGVRNYFDFLSYSAANILPPCAYSNALRLAGGKLADNE